VSEARLILTCGLPCAGKTTLATQLAAERRALRLTKDDWLWALGSTPWDEPAREKVEHELWRLAQEVLGLGLSVVLDFGLWTRVDVTSCAPPLAASVSASNCTTSTFRPMNSGDASMLATQHHGGTASRSVAPTSTGGSASSKRPMQPSWHYSIPRGRTNPESRQESPTSTKGSS
jgi:hypothetical protein